MPRPSHLLRMRYFLPHDNTVRLHTDADHYTGGWPQDEWAALMSLFLGVRLRAGDQVRVFQREGDPYGDPFVFGSLSGPALSVARRERGNVIPRLTANSVTLENAELLERFHEVTPGQSIALVKAARLYQAAVWEADAEPQETWLRLVSAVETAAVEWDPLQDDPVERFQTSRPEAAKILRERGGDDLLGKIAAELAPYMGATNKFLRFMTQFKPDPPEQRPKWHRFDFESSKAYRNALQRVYDYRSRALHAGTPFPSPMCHVPVGIEGHFEETPLGLASTSYGSTWAAADTPLLLHTFEHIARGALLRWWRSLLLPGSADADN